MKATGIVRKIDDLGRVVIPKEIRKNLRIREGDPLEIYIEKKGEIVLKKYEPMGDMVNMALQYADTLSKNTDFVACITDMESIIAVAGGKKEDYLSKEISQNVIDVMDDRAVWSTINERPISLILNDKPNKYSAQIIAPIICDADAIGTVILFSTDKSKKATNVEFKLLQSAATFLGKQMELN